MTISGLATVDGKAIPLRGVEVEGEVLGAHARVRVRQRYENAERRPVEAVYTFPLPADATLTGFSMTCDGRVVEGVVQEREAAFRAYDDAIVSGHGAALLEQERANVFTASVGNLLPGEETLVEVEYVQRLRADEAALRWMIPTLVAPRYIPGDVGGDRTAHGTHAPTDRVPDADRITPPRVAEVPYGLRIDVVFDLGREVTVESPSHAISTARDGTRVRVRFAQEREVALDRDVVLTARGAEQGVGQTSSVAAHRTASAEGYFSLGFVPDLWSLGAEASRNTRVVFLIDVSGSMEGDSLREAKAALRLCLRHLREGDVFNIIAFSSGHRALSKVPLAFGQRALEEADRWVNNLRADGGTELLEPLKKAVGASQDGVVILLTDGQVGNEAEILRATLQARGDTRTRVNSFGIGTNVSDALLRDLARETGGAVEFIHPGERIDEKVVAQFARAVAPRITDVTLRFEGLDVGELAPGRHPDVVDGEPWSVFGRYAKGGSGHAALAGRYRGEAFTLRIPVTLPEEAERPVVAKLWASERIRDLDDVRVEGRRAESMRARIIALSTEHGVASKYTSFVAIERRTGERRTAEMPETRVVPVGLPEGWAMFDTARGPAADVSTRGLKRKMARPPAKLDLSKSFGGGPASVPAPAPQRARSAATADRRIASADEPLLMSLHNLDAYAAGAACEEDDLEMPCEAAPEPMMMDFMEMEHERAVAPRDAKPAARKEEAPKGHDLGALFGRQLASGLWDDASLGADSDARRIKATLAVLRALLAAGVDTTHTLYGSPLRKALEAVAVTAVRIVTTDAATAERCLAAAWLLATGARTRAAVETSIRSGAFATLAAKLGAPAEVRAWLDAGA